MSIFSQAYGAAAGRLGKAIDYTGNFYGNILPEFNVSENLERIGGMLNPPTASAADYPTYTPSVQGASTIGPSPVYGPTYSGPVSSGGGSAQPVQQPTQQPQQQPQQQQSDPYDAVFSELDRASGLISGQQSQLNSQVNNMYETGLEGLQASKGLAQSELTAAGTEAKTQASNSLRDLYEDLRNQMQAGIIGLGAMGVGGSGVERFKGALGQAANKNRAQVLSSRDTALNEINLKQTQIEDTFRQQKSQLEQWKNDKVMEVMNWANSMINQYASMRPEIRMRAVSEAQNRLAQLDAQAQNYNSALQEWAMSRSNTVQQLAGNLQQLGAYEVPQMGYGTLPGIQSRTAGNVLPGAAYNPAANLRELEERGL